MLRTHYLHTPFLRILVPLICGIVVARVLSAPAWLLYTVAVAVYSAAWWVRRSSVGGAYIVAAVFLCGASLYRTSAPVESLPRGERMMMVVQVEETPFRQGRWQRTTAKVGSFQQIGDSLRRWFPCNEKIQLYVDTTRPITLGEKLAVRGYLLPIDTSGSSYGRLMRSRRMSARVYISASGVICSMNSDRTTLTMLCTRLQAWAVERLSRLPLEEEPLNLLTTLTVGERRGMAPGLRADYALTGTSHILSVSGLHMGFILILCNLALKWIVLFRRGHLLKNGLVILFLWIYAAMAGLSPPVVRAALMMSIVQLSFLFSMRGNSYNLLLGCAVVMLAMNPLYLGDISFQLSFLAILSILFFFPRLYRRKLHRNRLLDTLWSTLAITLAAQLGTLPLAAYTFGTIPLVAVVVNPLVILTSFVAICLGMFWILLPVSLLSKPVAWLIDRVLWLQNEVIHQAASLPGAALSDVQFPLWALIGIYTAMALLAVGILLREEQVKREPRAIRTD